MTVVNPKSISGINSITTGSGSDDILTIHTNNGTERLRVDSTGATKIVTGIVTTLTATTGIVTTLTTNTLTANSTTKVGSGVTLSPDGDVFATGISTFGDTIKGTAGIFSGAANVSYEALKLVNTQHDTNAEGAAAIKFGITNSLGERNARIEAKEESNNTNDIGLDFYTNSTSGVDSETLKMRVTAAGKVGIGISNPTGQFAVSDGTRTAEINPHSSGTFIGNRSNHDVLFQINAATKAKIDTNGHLTISDGDLVIGTAGHGIDFSATANGGSGTPSEILDDYEEGTWTPTVNAIASPNYTVQVGRYTKIGNLVNAQAYLLLYSGGGEGSNFRIASLPFTSTNTAYHDGGGYVTYENGFFSTNAGSAGATCTVWVPGNNTVIEFHERNSGNNIQGNSTNFGLGANNKYLVVQVQYIVA